MSDRNNQVLLARIGIFGKLSPAERTVESFVLLKKLQFLQNRPGDPPAAEMLVDNTARTLLARQVHFFGQLKCRLAGCVIESVEKQLIDAEVHWATRCSAGKKNVRE